MRILKKPKIMPVTCDECGCVFRPGMKDLKYGIVSKRHATCPICSRTNKVKFDTEADNESSN